MSGSEEMVRNATFDPYSQILTLTMPDGVTVNEFDITNIFYLQFTTVDTAIIFGVQLGISLILMLMLVLMTRPEKRRSMVFFLNTGALLFIFIRSAMRIAVLRGPLYNFYNWITGYYPNMALSIRIEVAIEVLNFLTIVAVEFSLFFQVRIVCCTLKTSWRLVVTAVTSFVALAVCAIRFALMVINSKWGIGSVGVATVEQKALVNNIASATNIAIIISIFLFSAIFIAKLGHAIHQRRSLGMKQFGPMQIIFVMGCQTMIIPCIFGLLAYIVFKGTQLPTMMPLMVATFLPLSSLWAATNTNNANIAAFHQRANRRRDIVVGPSSTANGSSANSSGRYHSDKQLLSDGTLIGEESPQKIGRPSSLDLEMAKAGHQIHVDRTYSVRSD